MKSKVDFLENLFRIWLVLKRFGLKQIAERNYDLTFEQVRVLLAIRHSDALSIKQIAEMTDRDRTTTSRMLDGLEKKDLLLRVPNRGDARQKLIYLTRAAREKLKELDQLKQDYYDRVFKNVNPEEIFVAANVLRQVSNNLEEN